MASLEPPTAFAAGITALERSRFNEALANFSVALEQTTKATQQAAILNKMALAQLGQNDRASAVETLSMALAADPTCVPAIVNIGNLLFEEGILDDALAHYEAALRIDALYAPAHFNVAVAYKRLGRRTASIRAFRRALRCELADRSQPVSCGRA